MCARGRRAPPSHLSSTSPGNVRCLRRPVAPCRWIITPTACLLRLNQTLLFRVRQITPTTRPLRGLLPPPPEGAGKCLAIDPDTVHGEQEKDSGRVFMTAERTSPVAPYRWGITPVGEGLTGRGVEHPPPLSRHGTENLSRWKPLSCLPHLWLNGLRGSPPPPGRSAASSRPLQRGRAVRGD